MKLNYEGRQKLRKEVEARLSLVPEGERIKLPKEILEQLLFEVDTVNLEPPLETYKVKYLVWSGEFLRKVDLSEVSFDDVSWFVGRGEGYGDDKQKHKGYYQYGVKKINLSGTNAKIDLLKSVECGCLTEEKPEYWLACFIMDNCNLSGVDLSNNTFNLAYYEHLQIENCDLDDTGINFCYTPIEGYEHKTKYLKLANSNFRNTNFADFNFRRYYEKKHEWEIMNCDFYNTRLKINFVSGNKVSVPDEVLDFLQKYAEVFKKCDYNPYKEYPGYCERLSEFMSFEERHRLLEIWNEYFDIDYEFERFFLENRHLLEGCYINGKRIPTKEEREATKAQLLGEYQQFEDETISSVLGEIDTAIKAIRK